MREQFYKEHFWQSLLSPVRSLTLATASPPHCHWGAPLPCHCMLKRIAYVTRIKFLWKQKEFDFMHALKAELIWKQFCNYLL